MDEDCTVYLTVDLIAKKWSLLIILSIYRGDLKPKRYSQIKKQVKGITPKVLSYRLKELEREGLIEKRVDAGSVPIKTFYSLTESGKDLIKIIII